MRILSHNAQNLLTISPFGNCGGNHEMMIFVLEAGMALIEYGAEGTAIIEIILP